MSSSTTDSLFLENIQEYVEDCNIIVTYKWLSRKLEVPVNTAKQMLYAYLEQDSSVEATYLISGVVAVGDAKEYRVCVVRKEELDSVKEELDQVLCVHVFSVQKSPLKDPETLYRSSYDICSQHLESYSSWSTIDCTCDERRGGGATQTRTTQVPRGTPQTTSSAAAPAKPAPKAAPKVTPTTTPKATPKVEETSKQQPAANPPQDSSKKVPSKSETSKVHTKPKSSFFSNMKKRKEDKADKDEKQDLKQKKESALKPMDMEAKKESTKKEKDGSKGETEEDVEAMDVGSPAGQETVSSGTTGPLKCTTNKYQEKVCHESDKKGSQTSAATSKTSQHRSLDFLNDGDVADGDSDNEEQSSETVTHSKPKKRQKKKGAIDAASKKISAVSSSSNETKKRKRVLELSSDEETDNSNQLQKENGGKRRKRIKKMVSKMYVNDEGEMVTERVWESESTDATEEEPTPVVPTKSSQDTTLPDPPVQKKKKQTSLFRFIKNK